METLCRIRDIYCAIAEFEARFVKTYGLSLNEGMLLCSLTKEEQLSSGKIAILLNLTASNTSKLIKTAEDKGLVERVMGDKDKRQMYFSLTAEGWEKIGNIQCTEVEIPDVLKPLVVTQNKYQNEIFHKMANVIGRSD